MNTNDDQRKEINRNCLFFFCFFAYIVKLFNIASSMRCLAFSIELLLCYLKLV